RPASSSRLSSMAAFTVPASRFFFGLGEGESLAEEQVPRTGRGRGGTAADGAGGQAKSRGRGGVSVSPQPRAPPAAPGTRALARSAAAKEAPKPVPSKASLRQRGLPSGVQSAAPDEVIAELPPESSEATPLSAAARRRKGLQGYPATPTSEGTAVAGGAATPTAGGSTLLRRGAGATPDLRSSRDSLSVGRRRLGPNEKGKTSLPDAPPQETEVRRPAWDSSQGSREASLPSRSRKLGPPTSSSNSNEGDTPLSRQLQPPSTPVLGGQVPRLQGGGRPSLKLPGRVEPVSVGGTPDILEAATRLRQEAQDLGSEIQAWTERGTMADTEALEESELCAAQGISISSDPEGELNSEDDKIRGNIPLVDCTKCSSEGSLHSSSTIIASIAAPTLAAAEPLAQHVQLERAADVDAEVICQKAIGETPPSQEPVKCDGDAGSSTEAEVIDFEGAEGWGGITPHDYSSHELTTKGKPQGGTDSNRRALQAFPEEDLKKAGQFKVPGDRAQKLELSLIEQVHGGLGAGVGLAGAGRAGGWWGRLRG
ncbi:unnamed protein product, partial [Polarella glacialis]